jgi:hypothetical protein
MGFGYQSPGLFAQPGVIAGADPGGIPLLFSML